MAQWKGAQTIAAMVYSGGSSWGAAGTACAGDSAFEFESESIKPSVSLIPNTGIHGTIFPWRSLKGNELHAGDIVVIPDYNVIDRFLAQVFGFGDAAEGPTWYLHTVKPSVNDLEGKHATIVLGHTGMYIREMPTVKITGFTLDAAADTIPKFTFHCVANRQIVDDTGTNNLASLTNITRTNPGESYNAFFLNFNELMIAMNAQGAAALDYATDKIFVNSLSLTVGNNMRGDSVTTKNAPYVDEPLRNGELQVTG